MNQQQFIQALQEEYTKNIAISKAKNADYSSESDAFSNFRVVASLGIDPKIGIIVRMTDKMARLSNLILKNKEGEVKDEAVGDTLSDLANYAMILKLFIQNDKN